MRSIVTTSTMDLPASGKVVVVVVVDVVVVVLAGFVSSTNRKPRLN